MVDVVCLAAAGAGLHESAQGGRAAGHDGPPCLGLGSAQGLFGKKHRAELTQNLSQARARDRPAHGGVLPASMQRGVEQFQR